MRNEDRVRKLIDEGYAYLESGDYDKAIEAGRQMEKEGHSSAFELIALAYAAKDDLSEAVSTLERGVKAAPAAGLLWQLLGNYYSDLSCWHDAQQAYTRALDCPNVDSSSVHYNIALAFMREGRLEEALSHIDQVSSDKLRLNAAALKIDVYSRSGDFVAAMQYADKIFSEASEADYSESGGDECAGLASVCCAFADAVYKQGNASQALGLVWQAVSLWKPHERAMWLVREIENDYSDHSRHYTLVLEGCMPEPLEGEEEPLGFFVNYEVVADSEDEAFKLAIRFEPDDVRESLRISECSISPEEIDAPKGVYSISCYHFYPINAEE